VRPPPPSATYHACVAALDTAKRIIFGRALRSDRLGDPQLSKRVALPAFASDALSSNAYATQEMLVVLAVGGFSLYSFGPWIAAAVIALYFIVIASYRQSVRAYPDGGGDYAVVTANLGPRWGVFTASAMLVDYTLTVAVSVSAAVATLGSVIPAVADQRTWWALGLIVLITVVNLRGIGSPGLALAIPTYLFIGSILLLVVWAIVRRLGGASLEAESAGWDIVAQDEVLGLALVLLVARAFSSGTTALTGIESIATGVPSFRKPRAINASSALLMLGIVSTMMFAAITWLALTTGVKVTGDDATLVGLPEGQSQKTVIVQVAEAVFGGFGIGVVLVSAATILVLAVAAHSAFRAFPVLGSVLARDGYLPRQLYTRGDRLSYSNGVLVLAAFAAALVVGFRASVSSLIQLYIIGVFVAFALGQVGMLRHWTRGLRKTTDQDERRRMQRSRAINAVGAGMSIAVLAVVTTTKFLSGAWIVVVALPVIFVVMLGVHRHYERVRVELAVGDDEHMTLPARVHGLVLVSKLHKPALRALAYARATRHDTLEALTVAVDPADTAALRRDWERRGIPVTLRVIESPYREITKPIVDYIKRLQREGPRDLVTVYVPEYVVGHWWEQLLHNQSALRLKTRLLFAPGVMVVSVPWQLASADLAADASGWNQDEEQAPRVT
jgi:amino acid transporter